MAGAGIVEVAKQLQSESIEQGNCMSLGSHSARAVAVVTGGSSQLGRDVAHELSSWGWPIVVVYLDHQSRAEATVAEIIAAGGTTVGVRADLGDDLDVHRLFSESIAAFGRVDIVVHTTAEGPAILYQHAARHVGRRGAIVSTTSAQPVAPEVESSLRERGITVDRVPEEGVVPALESFRQRAPG